jgi:hypothetical protein
MADNGPAVDAASGLKGDAGAQPRSSRLAYIDLQLAARAQWVILLVEHIVDVER